MDKEDFVSLKRAMAQVEAYRLVEHKPVEKSVIVTFYLSIRKGSIPSFHTRLELDEIPAVGSTYSIPGEAAEKALVVTILANSKNDPNLTEVLRDSGDWVICQEE